MAQYMARRAEHEQRLELEGADWRNRPLGLPRWEDRPTCACGDRCQVVRSRRPGTLRRRSFVCPNILDNDIDDPPRRCQFRQWIDNSTPSYLSRHWNMQPESPADYSLSRSYHERIARFSRNR
ncbi:hypothetical protein E2562_028658 [Oryza meyeriana var. granulata]|nr:hypothetical protein E2562_028658 [Oryza meyeriana var. granulata]